MHFMLSFRQLQEALSSIATVRTFGGENYEKKRFEELGFRGRWSFVQVDQGVPVLGHDMPRHVKR